MQKIESYWFYYMTKGDRTIVLTQFQIPSDARDQVLLAYAKSGYEVKQERKQAE